MEDENEANSSSIVVNPSSEETASTASTVTSPCTSHSVGGISIFSIADIEPYDVNVYSIANHELLPFAGGVAFVVVAASIWNNREYLKKYVCKIWRNHSSTTDQSRREETNQQPCTSARARNEERVQRDLASIRQTEHCSVFTWDARLDIDVHIPHLTDSLRHDFKICAEELVAAFQQSNGGQGFKFHCPIRSKTTICIEIKRKPDPVINQLILDVWAKLRCLKRKYRCIRLNCEATEITYVPEDDSEADAPEPTANPTDDVRMEDGGFSAQQNLSSSGSFLVREERVLPASSQQENPLMLGGLVQDQNILRLDNQQTSDIVMTQRPSVSTGGATLLSQAPSTSGRCSSQRTFQHVRNNFFSPLDDEVDESVDLRAQNQVPSTSGLISGQRTFEHERNNFIPPFDDEEENRTLDLRARNQEPSTFGLGISQRTFPPEQRNNYPPPRADEGDHASLSLQTLNQAPSTSGRISNQRTFRPERADMIRDDEDVVVNLGAVDPMPSTSGRSSGQLGRNNFIPPLDEEDESVDFWRQNQAPSGLDRSHEVSGNVRSNFIPPSDDESDERILNQVAALSKSK